MSITSQRHLNGVDTTTLFATIDAVRQQPEAARFQFRVTNNWVSGTHSRGRFPGYFGAGAEHVHLHETAIEADHPAVLVGQDNGPTPAELAAAKSYLIGSYPLRFNTSTKIANQLLNIQLDELGIDYINRRNGLIEAITIDDVRRVAKRLFGNGDFIVVRVGQPES